MNCLGFGAPWLRDYPEILAPAPELPPDLPDWRTQSDILPPRPDLWEWYTLPKVHGKIRYPDDKRHGRWAADGARPHTPESLRTARIIQKYGAPADTREVTAAHEAGHYVVGQYIQGVDPLGPLYIEGTGGRGGWFGECPGQPPLSRGLLFERPVPLNLWMLADIAADLGGWMGEYAAGFGHVASSTHETCGVADKLREFLSRPGEAGELASCPVDKLVTFAQVLAACALHDALDVFHDMRHELAEKKRLDVRRLAPYRKRIQCEAPDREWPAFIAETPWHDPEAEIATWPDCGKNAPRGKGRQATAQTVHAALHDVRPHRETDNNRRSAGGLTPAAGRFTFPLGSAAQF